MRNTKEESRMPNQNNSLSHTKWMCKYHIVFTPKYRRKAIYGQYRDSIGQIIRQLCNYKGVEIIEGHLMPDHVHILVSIPPKYSVSQFMGYLKGKSSLMIFDKHANLKYKFGNRHFWAEGYYVSTVGLNEATIAKYIREQEAHDIAMDKVTEKDRGKGVHFERIRRITGYLTGSLDSWNTGKRAEEKDRVKHSGLKDLQKTTCSTCKD